MKKYRKGNYGLKFEDAVATALRELVQSFKRSGQVYIPYTPLSASYTPDMVINDVIIEVKTYLDSDDQKKMRAVKQSNPNLDIRFVFEKPDKLLPQHKKMTHAGFAEKYGFPWTTIDKLHEWF